MHDGGVPRTRRGPLAPRGPVSGHGQYTIFISHRCPGSSFPPPPPGPQPWGAWGRTPGSTLGPPPKSPHTVGRGGRRRFYWGGQSKAGGEHGGERTKRGANEGPAAGRCHAASYDITRRRTTSRGDAASRQGPGGSRASGTWGWLRGRPWRGGGVCVRGCVPHTRVCGGGQCLPHACVAVPCVTQVGGCPWAARRVPLTRVRGVPRGGPLHGLVVLALVRRAGARPGGGAGGCSRGPRCPGTHHPPHIAPPLPP